MPPTMAQKKPRSANSAGRRRRAPPFAPARGGMPFSVPALHHMRKGSRLFGRTFWERRGKARKGAQSVLTQRCAHRLKGKPLQGGNAPHHFFRHPRL